MVYSMNENPSDYYLVPRYPQQSVRLMPTPGHPSPNPEDLLNAIYNDIKTQPDSTVSAIRNKHRPYCLSYSPPGQPNPVDGHCSQVLGTGRRHAKINDVLPCSFILNYVKKEEFESSGPMETNAGSVDIIRQVYDYLVYTRYSGSDVTLDAKMVGVNRILANIVKDPIKEDCENKILDSPGGRPLALVVPCDFITNYWHAIMGRQ